MRNFLIGARRRSHAKCLPARFDQPQSHKVRAVDVVLHIIGFGESVGRDVISDARICRRTVLVSPQVNDQIVGRRVWCPSLDHGAAGVVARLEFRHDIAHLPSNDLILRIGGGD